MSTVAEVGDVIQIDPNHDERFGGCFAFVEEVMPWGVGLCGIPSPGIAPRQVFYYRVPHGGYAVIGKAEWLLSDEEPEA